MTTQKHLTAIRAKCVELLETAKLRTGLPWVRYSGNEIYGTEDGDGVRVAQVDDDNDFDFIASCAGPAEAGWAATIAAIDWLDRMGAMMGLNSIEQKMADAIIAAWPEELLK